MFSIQIVPYSARGCFFWRQSGQKYGAIRHFCIFLSHIQHFTSAVWSTMRLTRKRRHLLKAFLLLLCLVEYYNRICKRKYLLREAVLLPCMSPWHQLMDFGDASLFLLMTGLTREAFDTLHDILKPPGYHRFQRTKGRSWPLPSYAQLGLLFYLGSTMNYKHLCLIFGITPSACSLYTE